MQMLLHSKFLLLGVSFSVGQGLVKAVCLGLWGYHMNLSWCHMNDIFLYLWEVKSKSGVVLEPHIFNTWPLFPNPQRRLADNQVGGSGEKQTLPQALPLCTCLLTALQFTSGLDKIPSLNLSARLTLLFSQQPWGPVRWLLLSWRCCAWWWCTQMWSHREISTCRG